MLALQGDSLGAQLRRRRRELGLHRIDVAALIGCDPKSLMWWERDEREPVVNQYPGVISFLGYEPWSEPTTLAEALLAERRRRGFCQAAAAVLARVDEGTWRRWETGEWKPTKRTLQAINKFLGVAIAQAFPTDVR